MVTDYFSEYERARIECNDALQPHKEFMDLLGFYWKRIEAGQDPDLGDRFPTVAYTHLWKCDYCLLERQGFWIKHH